MKPTHALWLLTLGLVAMTACGPTAPVVTDPPPVVVPPDQSPPADPPNLDRTSSVLGTDADSNGVRDDIDRMIADYPVNSAQKNTLTRFAQSTQTSLTTGRSRDKAYETAVSLQRILKCGAQPLMDAEAVTAEIMDFTLNTQQRVEAYLEFEGALGGSVINEPNCLATASSTAILPLDTPDPNNLCVASGYVIAYFNGVGNTYLDAERARDRLKSIYGTTYSPNGQGISYRLFYNPTEGFLKDLTEVFKQKEQETPAIRGRWELLWSALRGTTNSRLLLDPVADRVVQSLREAVVTLTKTHTEGLILRAPSDTVTSGFVTTMNGLVTERKKVLAVAHSQGNLYLNAVYDKVRPGLTTESLKTVHVAPASATVRGPYVLSDNDMVIKALGAALGFTLEPNVEMPLRPIDDRSGHGFLESYMDSGYSAYDRVKTGLDTQLASLQDPESNATSGFFTVTLDWDGVGDVDLHTFEPSSHVYYEDKAGAVGYLDVDNVDGFGPEHYYASCNKAKMQEGIYAFGINNYEGATGRMATLLLSTQERTYDPLTLSVGAERGNEGNQSPHPCF